MSLASSPSARRWRFSVRPTPRATQALKTLRLPAFWVLAAIIFFGGVRLIDLLRSPMARFPVATITAIVLFALYAVPFWWFIASMDFLEREPPLLKATAFAWGAVVATTTAMPGNRAMLGLLAKTVSPEYAAAWGPAVASPIIEEFLKALGLVMIALIAAGQINSVLDGMVYGALIGLGFQIVENVFYALNAVEMANAGDRTGPVIATFLVRGFLAGLWSHTVFGALAGAGVAWFIVRTDHSLPVRGLVAGLGVGLAWALHFVWNSPILTDGLGASVLVGLLLKGMPALGLALGLLVLARHREADYYVAALAQLNDSAIATDRELYTLRRGHLRADARRHAKWRAGRRGKKAVRALQAAQAALAVELSRSSGDPAIRRNPARGDLGLGVLGRGVLGRGDFMWGDPARGGRPVGEPARGDLARGDLARGDLARGDLGGGDLARGDLARGDLARGDLARGHLARGHLGGGDLGGDPATGGQAQSGPVRSGSVQGELAEADEVVVARDRVLACRAQLRRLGLEEAVALPWRGGVPRIMVLGILALLFFCALVWLGT